jgi:hypothetical protein
MGFCCKMSHACSAAFAWLRWQSQISCVAQLRRFRASLSLSLSLLLTPTIIRTSTEPPLGPGSPELSPWIPVGGNPGSSDEACGFWWWSSGGVKMTTPYVKIEPIRFYPSGSHGSGWFEVGLTQPDNKSLSARASLWDSCMQDFCLRLGETGPLEPQEGGAERIGFLRWTGPTSGLLNTRIRLTSTARVTGAIDLDYGLVVAGETTRIASGGMSASIKTSGDYLGPRIAAAMTASRTSAVVSPSVSHASTPQQSGLGAGVTVGSDNGANFHVQWQLGGSRAWIRLVESMRCVEWDCVTPPANAVFVEWYFDQVAHVMVDAALIRGKESIVRAQVRFGDFKIERQGCPSCIAPPAVEPGQTGGQAP